MTVADLPLFAQPPRARRTDPDTSHEAAASVRETQRRSQEEVLYVLRLYSRLTDERLVALYEVHARDGDVSHQSPSGIRTRRKELQRAGLVKAHGEERAASGRRMIVWGPAHE